MSVAERPYPAQSGFSMMLVNGAVALGACLFFAFSDQTPLGFLLLLLAVAMLKGYVVLQENEALALRQWGKYEGHVSGPGFYWVHPLLRARRVSVGLRQTPLQGRFCDARGVALEARGLLRWRIAQVGLASGLPEDMEALALAEAQASMAHVLGSLPYQAKQGGLKGQKQEVERRLRLHAQQRLQAWGAEAAEVQLWFLSADASADALHEQQQWALQAPLLAHKLVQQLDAQAPLSPEAKQGLLQSVLLALLGKGH